MVLSSPDAAAHRKPCTLCATPRDVLIRCQIDSTGAWHLVCPGRCWHSVSGGVADGDAAHPHYRYGGAWKNRWADVTAKKPASVKKRQKQARTTTPQQWTDVEGTKFATNDRVLFEGAVWVCRKGHRPREGEEPPSAHHLWKEDDGGSVHVGASAGEHGDGDGGGDGSGGAPSDAAS